MLDRAREALPDRGWALVAPHQVSASGTAVRFPRLRPEYNRKRVKPSAIRQTINIRR